MQTQNLIDKKNRLLLDAHNQCEVALAAVHSRMKDASKAYGDAYEEALNQQLKIVTESTITEDTLNQEMLIAANAHRDSIEKMTAIPPLFMDDTRIHLQIRCAAAEEKAEDLQRKRQVTMDNDPEGKIASLWKELEMSREELGELRKVNQSLDEKLRKVNSVQDQMKREAQTDEAIMVRLRKKLEAAESELEGLKRKRADSISPERGITSILKRPAASSPSGQNVPSSSAQPTPKKARNRKDSWVDHSSSVPSKIPLTSTNRDGLKGKNVHASPPRRRDPVLLSSLSSVRRKHEDIINDMLKKLHARLGCYNFHHIPIGFYYAKWSEKLNFHLARAGRQDRSLSSTSRTRTTGAGTES
jgi:hypothetical protein